MTVTKRADELKPGDLRECGRHLGLQRVKKVERVESGELVVWYVDGWGHRFPPDAEVRVAV